MGPEAAAEVIFRRELESAENRQEALQEKITEYREKFADPYYYASSMNIEDVIVPEETRWRIINGFRRLEGKNEQKNPRKHGNIPL